MAKPPSRPAPRPLFQAHPWHGVEAEPEPGLVHVYVEVVPTDTVKYELDKTSGHLRVDRPQRFSSHCPALYGFVPQTYCGERVGALAHERSGREVKGGDGDPLDICVLTERTFAQGAFLLKARPIGGLRLLDKGEADDKLIAVLANDGVYGQLRDLSECPAPVLDRLRHYFLTYKLEPGQTTSVIESLGVYDQGEAAAVLARSREDYAATFVAS